jgi:protein-disulfide isomerase
MVWPSRTPNPSVRRSSRAAKHRPILLPASVCEGPDPSPLGPRRAVRGRRGLVAETAALVLTGVVALAAPAAGQWAMLAQRAQGRVGAPITVYEMSDFQCPYCREFALEILPALVREYVTTGKIRFVFINFPLANAHPDALLAAEVAMCAATQSVFWRFHDLAFQHQHDWEAQIDPGPYLEGLADSAGAQPTALARCVRNGTMEAVVNADAAAATRVGVSTTPTFFLEGGLLEGAPPLAVFQQVLDSIYAAKVGRPPR